MAKNLNACDHFFYKGFMVDGAPSMFMATGYTTVSWSLGCDLIARAQGGDERTVVHAPRLLLRPLEHLDRLMHRLMHRLARIQECPPQVFLKDSTVAEQIRSLASPCALFQPWMDDCMYVFFGDERRADSDAISNAGSAIGFLGSRSG